MVSSLAAVASIIIRTAGGEGQSPQPLPPTPWLGASVSLDVQGGHLPPSHQEKKHFEKRVVKKKRSERSPPSASVSLQPAKAPPPPQHLSCRVHLAAPSASRPPAQGPHLEPAAPQEARLVHGPGVRAARPAPGPASACQAPPPGAIGQAGQLTRPGPAPPGRPTTRPRLHWASWPCPFSRAQK